MKSFSMTHISNEIVCQRVIFDQSFFVYERFFIFWQKRSQTTHILIKPLVKDSFLIKIVRELFKSDWYSLVVHELFSYFQKHRSATNHI